MPRYLKNIAGNLRDTLLPEKRTVIRGIIIIAKIILSEYYVLVKTVY